MLKSNKMETDRLYFREQTSQLLEEVFNKNSKEQLMFFGLETIDQLDAEIVKLKNKLLNSNKIDWKKWDLIEKSSGKVIGSCGFHNWDAKHERAELGYSLHEMYRKKGFMTDAIRRIIEFGFNEMKLHKVYGRITPGHNASIRILGKFGFQKEGVLRGDEFAQNKYFDTAIYSLINNK